MTSADAPVPAKPLTGGGTDRLVSLDVFRGVVILSMLVVNNPGDHRLAGSFLRHADWDHPSLWADLSEWWSGLGTLGLATVTHFPLLQQCTLADFVMPLFMLIIGIAMPFSVESARRRGVTGARAVLATLRRGMTLVALGWAIGLSLQYLAFKESTNPNARLMFSLRMDVLQLLGVAFMVARLVYELPVRWRLVLAGAMYVFHWSLLRFYPQGSTPTGTFTEAHNAVGYIYGTWGVFHDWVLVPNRLTFSVAGMLSVPPAAATMLVGSWVGQTLRDPALQGGARIRRLVWVGLALMVLGIAWSFDLAMNKPRWTPCYLLYCSGVGSLLMAATYYVVDIRQSRWWTWPLVALGVNAIGIYFASVFGKIWALNMWRVAAESGGTERLTDHLVHVLQGWTTPVVGSYLFTACFAGVLWLLAMVAYRYRIIWKV